MSDQNSDKRNVIVLANCQGWVLMTGLAGYAPDLTGTHKVRMYQNFVALPPEYPEHASTADIYVYQYEIAANVQRSDRLIREHLPSTARIVQIPSAGFAPLWPSFVRDFKKHSDPRYPKLPCGPLQWKDRFLERWLRAGVPRAEIIDRWLALDMVSELKIDRLMELWTIKQRQLEMNCDVGFSDVALALMAERQLFFWPEHPSTFLLMNLVDRVLAHFGMQPLMPKAYREKDYLKDKELPVHPSIASHLGLKWASPDRTYFAPWGEDVTTRGFLEFYLDYATETVARAAAL